MSTNLKVRTPAHFGELSLLEAVRKGSHPAGDFTLARLFDAIHLSQGTLHPEVDLTSRVSALAQASKKSVNEEELLTALLARLTDNYATIFIQNDALSSTGIALSFTCNPIAADELLRSADQKTNELFSDQLVLWQKAVKTVTAADALVALKIKNSLPMEKMLEELAEATRKGRHVEKAERRVAQANADILAVEVARAAYEVELVKFALVREDMVPIRFMEDVTRPIKHLFAEEKPSTEEAIVLAISALGRLNRFYPELFSSTVETADSLLETYLN